MPKDSGTNKKKTPNPKPGKRQTNKAKNIKARAEHAAKAMPKDTVYEKANIQTYGNEEKVASKLSRSLYSDFLLPKIESLAALGLTNKEIATAMCIGERTLYDWMNTYPQCLHAIKKYRGVADIQIENALFNSALGYNVTETKNERRRVGKDEQGNWIYDIVPTEQVVKFIPGNATAQIFYLKNRMPERYRDKIETVHSLGSGMEQIQFELVKRED